MTTNLKDKGKTPMCKLVRLRIWSNKSNLITSFIVHASKIILLLGLLWEVFKEIYRTIEIAIDNFEQLTFLEQDANLRFKLQLAWFQVCWYLCLCAAATRPHLDDRRLLALQHVGHFRCKKQAESIWIIIV